MLKDFREKECAGIATGATDSIGKDQKGKIVYGRETKCSEKTTDACTEVSEGRGLSPKTTMATLAECLVATGLQFSNESPY